MTHEGVALVLPHLLPGSGYRPLRAPGSGYRAAGPRSRPARKPSDRIARAVTDVNNIISGLIPRWCQDWGGWALPGPSRPFRLLGGYGIKWSVIVVLCVHNTGTFELSSGCRWTAVGLGGQGQ